MAIIVHTQVPGASEADADRFDQRIGAAMEERGGPPAGLMAHVAYPSGDGFVVCNVWRSEADMRTFYAEVVLPGMAEAGFEPAEPAVSPVWSFAVP